MKKIFVILVAILLVPVMANAEVNITTSFNEETCVLTVSGVQTGHEATVSLFDNSELIGFKTGQIDNGNYSVEFVIGKDTASTIDITVSNENGGNEINKHGVNIPACTPPEKPKTNELFDHENSIVINEGEFEDGDYFQLETYTEEEMEELLASLEGTQAYEGLKQMRDKVLEEVGDYRQFISYINVFVRNRDNENIDYSNYKGKFTLNLAIPKVEYQVLKGLRIGLFNEQTLTIDKELDYEYDEEAEILVLTIDEPCALVAYLDNDYEFLDKTANQKYSLADGTTLTLKIDAYYLKLVDVFVDGKLVDSKYYSVEEGSTVVTFKKDYMQSLSVGDYTVDVHFRDGTASTTITVEKDNNPLTGDKVMTYIIILAVSLAGIIIIGLSMKKKKKK